MQLVLLPYCSVGFLSLLTGKKTFSQVKVHLKQEMENMNDVWLTTQQK